MKLSVYLRMITGLCAFANVAVFCIFVATVSVNTCITEAFWRILAYLAIFLGYLALMLFITLHRHPGITRYFLYKGFWGSISLVFLILLCFSTFMLWSIIRVTMPYQNTLIVQGVLTVYGYVITHMSFQDIIRDYNTRNYRL